MSNFEKIKPLIKVSRVSKSFKMYKNEKEKLLDFLKIRPKKDVNEVIKDLSLNIYPGEKVGFIGKNGTGKTTLLRMIARMSYPDKGYIKINGRGSIAAMFASATGFINDSTGRENIYLQGILFGLTRKEIKKREKEIIEFSELNEYIDMPIKTYSSGMRARLAFSIKVNFDFDIYVIDEALAVGDRKFREKSSKKMKEILKKDGKTVIYVSHDNNDVKNWCDKIYDLEIMKKMSFNEYNQNTILVNTFKEEDQDLTLGCSFYKNSKYDFVNLIGKDDKNNIFAAVIDIKTKKKYNSEFEIKNIIKNLKFDKSCELNFYDQDGKKIEFMYFDENNLKIKDNKVTIKSNSLIVEKV